MQVKRYFGISKRRQRQFTRAMQLILFGLLFVALERNAPNLLVTVGIGLGATFLPAILERDYEISMDPALALWITSAAFMHVIGVAGLPGLSRPLYNVVPFYDHFTHALSASVVTAVGYATVRAVNEHSDGIHLPPRFMFVFLVVFVVAFGVIWELLEFGIDVASRAIGFKVTGFTQHGLEDTMLDIVFDTLGGVLVGIWGTVYLTDVAGQIQTRLAGKNSE